MHQAAPLGGKHRIRSAAAVLVACLAGTVHARAAPPLAPRDAPAKTLPVPDTVSPAMQAIIAQPLRTNWDKPPTTPEGWKALSDSFATLVAPQIGPMAERLRVRIEPTTIDGVRAYTITPSDVPHANRHRVAVHTRWFNLVARRCPARLPARADTFPSPSGHARE